MKIALLQNELNSDVAHVQPTFEPVLQQIRLQDLFSWVVKKRNIVIQLVLQPCCKTSCLHVFAARFPAP